MKKSVLIILLVVCVFAAALQANGAEAVKGGENIPAEVLEYAENTAFPYAVGFMQNSGNEAYKAYDRDELKLGAAYQCADYVLSSREDAKLSELMRYKDMWLFTIEAEGQPVVLFTVFRNNGVLEHQGIEDAANFNSAMSIMRRLTEKESVSFEPVVISTGDYCTAVYQSFNGDERVITVPTSAFRLDPDYEKVAAFTELPKAEELIAADKEAAEAAAEGGLWGADAAALKPHIGTESTAVKRTLSPVWLAAIIAAFALAIAGIAAAARKSRKA